jgi:hypothetical protein
MRLIALAALTLLLATGAGCRSVNFSGDCGHCGGRHGMIGHHGGHGHHGHGGLAHDGHGGHGHHGHGHHGGLAHDGHGGHGFHGYGDHVPYGAAGYKKPAIGREYVGPEGPPTAQVAYPYYTVRGPRDFLIDNPPSIGPY